VLVRVSRPRSTRQFSRLCPIRASSQCFSQASGASRSQHRLSSFLLTKDGSRGCNAVGCANTNDHRPTNTRNSFSAPEAVLSEVEQRFDCVQAQTHMYPSLVGGFHPHPEPNSSPPSPKSPYHNASSILSIYRIRILILPLQPL
jgi:hypothetical protein